MHKYKDHRMKNTDTLMEMLFNPAYWQVMFKLIGLSPKQIQEYLIPTANSSLICEDWLFSTSPGLSKNSPQHNFLKMYDCVLQLTNLPHQTKLRLGTPINVFPTSRNNIQ
ncbi:hypothetical protein O181_057367 [Austropuccinia psidii MF-1]|uniref:Uncharacterized protein n=1 Tax=Austropuccinia psidii MF-1 TaxID=1389203 RepID=A0A9Q3EHN8_9BASI|nr:hypothetical protein [Austropuccinia psidii MF-1]